MLRKARCAGSLKKLLGTPEELFSKKALETYIKGGVDKKGDNPTKTKGRFIVSNSFHCFQGVVPSLNSLFGLGRGRFNIPRHWSLNQPSL